MFKIFGFAFFLLSSIFLYDSLILLKVLRDTKLKGGVFMLKSKKIIMSLMSAAAVSILLVGCGGQSNKSSKNEIEVFSTKSENLTILKTLAKKFEKENDGLKIKITAPADAGTVLKTRLTKDDIPDVLAMGGDATFAELQNAGVLEDLSNANYISEVQDSYKKMVTDLYNETKLYGVPYATNASGILYNKDIFEANGVAVPKTWDEFMSICETFKSNDIQPLELTFKDSWTTLPIWNSLAPSLEPTNFTKDRKDSKTTFSNDFQEIAKKYLDVLNYGQKDYMGTTYADGNQSFAEGNAAMMINGNWAIPEFKKTNSKINVDIFAFPSSNDVSKNYVTSGVDVLFAVGKKSKVKDNANKFIEFMMEKENAQVYINDQFAFSAIKDVVQEDQSLSGVKQEIAEGKVADFPDHAYPSGLDLGSLLSEFALNKSNNESDSKNIKAFLSKVDEAYDTANVD